jgi:hypothetical protein
MMPDDRKELFSEMVSAGSRVYVFDVKQSKDGTRYLLISELRKTKESSEPHRVMVFQESLDLFCAGLDKALGFLGIENKPKTYKVETIRREYPKAYQPWTTEEDENLRKKYAEGLKIAELADYFERQPSAIESRLVKLGLRRNS